MLLGSESLGNSTFADVQKRKVFFITNEIESDISATQLTFNIHMASLNKNIIKKLIVFDRINKAFQFNSTKKQLIFNAKVKQLTFNLLGSNV